VPAEPSSPIPQGLAPLRDADPLRPAESPHLLAYLATIPDPRRPAGCRHPLACILGLAAAAVLAGAVHSGWRTVRRNSRAGSRR